MSALKAKCSPLSFTPHIHPFFILTSEGWSVFWNCLVRVDSVKPRGKGQLKWFEFDVSHYIRWRHLAMDTLCDHGQVA